MTQNRLTLGALSSMSESPSTPADASFAFLHPTRENLPVAVYNSDILKVEPSYEASLDESSAEGKLIHIDVFHELTNHNGVSEVFRFRLFPAYDGIAKWAKSMARYGLTGDIFELVGLRERVKIAHGTRGNYAYIAARELVALPTPKSAGNADEVSEEADVNTSSEAKPSEDKPRKKGLLSSRSNRPSKTATSQMKKLILDDDDDDDFDIDMLDDED